MRRIVCVALASAVLAAPSRAATNSQPLQPVTKWDLDYGETQCMAVRDFGRTDKPISFAIRPAPNGETYELLVARQSPAPQFAEELEGSVDFGSGPIKAWLLHYGTTKTKLDVYQYRISAGQMAEARSAHAVTLTNKDAPDFAFQLDSIPALLDGLAACTADLKNYWNMGGVKGGIIATPSKGDVRSVFTADDYPAEAMKHFQEGRAQYLLLIDEKGHVAGCHVLVASGVPALDAMGCQVIQQRAKFIPARDHAGKPVRSTVVTPPVSWQIEG